MVIKKKILNPREKEIIRTIHKRSGNISANEIATLTGFSYVTVRKYLNTLTKKEILVKRKLLKAKLKAKKKTKSSTTRGQTERYNLNYKKIYGDKR